MSRDLGSNSTVESKIYAQELEKILGTQYKYNFDMIRALELLICRRVEESVLEFDESVPIEDRIVTVEIPLIGNIRIKPRKFHSKHRLTGKSSLHFDFEFEPISCFKLDIEKAYIGKDSTLTNMFSSIYEERLKSLYERLRKE